MVSISVFLSVCLPRSMLLFWIIQNGFFLQGIFFLIVLDRIIYLCSFATGKVIFYLFNFVLFTCSVTKYAWNIELRNRHAARFALCAIYFTKAISLSLQAIQIRFGIPHKSTLYRQFLTSSISQVNYFGFRLYRALPFLYELRCVLDWSCTTTSLTMYDWLKVCPLLLKYNHHYFHFHYIEITQCASDMLWHAVPDIYIKASDIDLHTCFNF